MVWIISRISLILPKEALNHLLFTKFKTGVKTGYISNIMFGFHEAFNESNLTPHHPFSTDDMNFRKARSEENIISSAPYNSWWPSGQTLCEERYFSTETNNPFKLDQFATPEGHRSNYLAYNSMVPHSGTCGFAPTITPHNFLMPINHNQAIQKRYFIKQNGSAVASNDQKEVTQILKVLSKRQWQEVNCQRKKSVKHSFEFLLMSYNVLAQNLLEEHPYLYKFHNQNALNWELRWKNLYNEIKTMRPDVLCLQEVQETHLKAYFCQLESLGYEGLYKKRTGIRCDGCAIYYKPDRLILVEYETVEFYQPNVNILNRDNIAIIAKFSPRNSPDRHFIVATTHLLYNPKRQDVRLAQTQLLLTEVERLSFYWNSKGIAKYWPIIITGDFNSTPDSAVYQLITKGVLKYDHLAEKRLHRPESPRHGNILVPNHLEITDSCQHAGLMQRREKNADVSRSEESALIKLYNSDKSVSKISSETIIDPELFSSGTLSHLFALKSAYQHGLPEDPEGTTFQDQWITVDYIFYSGKKRGAKIDDHKLKLLSIYRLPLKSELGSMKLPNSLMGSDHLSLVAKFKLKI